MSSLHADCVSGEFDCLLCACLGDFEACCLTVGCLCVVWPDSLPVLELKCWLFILLITMRVLRCPPKVYPRYDVLAAAMHMCLTALIVHSVHDNWTD